VIRLRLTARDLTRIRVQPGLGPFGEALFSFDVVRRRSHVGEFHPWAERMRANASDLVRSAAVLFTMHGPPLDLFSHVGPTPELDSAIDQLLSIPDSVYRDELRFVLAARRLPPWIASMTGTDLHSRRLLARAISEAATTLVLPNQERVQSFLTAERAEPAAAIGRIGPDGVDRMLANLHPLIRWTPPWLTVGIDDGGRRTYVAQGEGVTFIPSVLMGHGTIVFRPLDGSGRWLVLYSAVQDLSDLVRLYRDPDSPDAAARLIGQSRSDLLMTIADCPGLPVTKLAALVGLSMAVASEHLAVLRNAGLIEGRREGKSHTHALTALGAAVLLAGVRPVDSVAD